MANTNTAYTSKYTGEQIDTAVGAFLAGGYSVYATVNCTTNDWKSPASGIIGPGKYFCQITIEKVLGNVYPQVFAVMNEKTYCEGAGNSLEDGLVVVSPYVVFKAPGSNAVGNSIDVCLWSNVKITGTIVFTGSSNANSSATATINK